MACLYLAVVPIGEACPRTVDGPYAGGLDWALVATLACHSDPSRGLMLKASGDDWSMDGGSQAA